MTQPPTSGMPAGRRDEEQVSTIAAGAAPRALDRRSALRLWLCGIGMLVPIFAFAWRYPLGSNSSTLTDIGKLIADLGPQANSPEAPVTPLLLLVPMTLIGARVLRRRHRRSKSQHRGNDVRPGVLRRRARRHSD